MKKITLPAQDVPFVDAKGRVDPIWYEKLTALADRGVAGLPDVVMTGITNGQVLVWDSTQKKFIPANN